MMAENNLSLSIQIVNKAIGFGASLAGIMNVEDLKKSPSHIIASKIPDFARVGTKDVKGKKCDEVQWPDNAKSGVVIAVMHLKEKPELDWWEKGLKGGTKGNFKLISIFSKLADWIEKSSHIKCIKTPYHIEQGGVYMKDAAVLAGIGCIGKNNMLVTPKFGPRVRLRVMLLDIDFSSTGILDFDPCIKCEEYCKKICPKNAFDKKLYSEDEFKLKNLPSRTGWYDRYKCNVQMEKDNKDSMDVMIKNNRDNIQNVKYCRQCEISCPIGKS
jgi:epoxyqueuosine reductase